MGDEGTDPRRQGRYAPHEQVAIPGHEILRLLGEGGMGCVYLARDLALDRLVAVKLMSAGLGEDESSARFLREARTMATVLHPHVVRVHALGESQGRHFLIMEYVAGDNLARRVAENGPLPLDETLRIVDEARQALDAVWRKGVIHRDVKPSNILLDEAGSVRLADFGLAKSMRRPEDITLPGAGLLCTPGYISPEQARGCASLDLRTDIYSLGIVLYEMLVGERPFHAPSPLALVAKHLEEPLPDVRAHRSNLPAAVVSLLGWMTQKRREQRLCSYDELGHALSQITSIGGSTAAKRASRQRACPSASPPIGTDTPAFVGRDDELARLASALAQAAEGRGLPLFVSGEAGTGKTALVTEFVRRSQRANVDLVVASARCTSTTTRSTSLAPFRDMLATLIGCVTSRGPTLTSPDQGGPRLRQIAPITAAALMTHGTDLVGTFITETALREATEETLQKSPDWILSLRELATQRQSGRQFPAQRAQLFDQYASTLNAIARARPLLLLIDDMQWIDDASVELLFVLGRAIPHSRILFVGIFRGAEISLGRNTERHPLAAVVNELERVTGEPRIELPQREPRAFVDSLIDREANRLSDTFREELHRHTGGHAMFTVELIRSMQARGAIAQAADGYWVERAPFDWNTLPARVDAVIRERIDRLTFRLRELLDLASVDGVSFSAEVVAACLKLDAGSVVRVISDELHRRHRLVDVDGTKLVGSVRLSAYRFSHALFHRYVYETLEEAERAYLHRRIGEAWESLHGARDCESAHHRAHHFELAGVTDKAIDCHLLAADQAVRTSFHQDALAHLDRSLELLHQLPDRAARIHRELEIRIARASSLIVTKGVIDVDVGEDFLRTRELASQTGSTILECDASIMLGLHHGFLQEPDRGTACARHAERLAEQLGDADRITESRSIQGLNLVFAGRIGDAISCLASEAEIDDPCAEPPKLLSLGTDSLVAVLVWYATALALYGSFDRARGRCTQAVQRSRQIGHPHSLAAAYWHTSFAGLEQGRCEEAEPNIKEMLRLTEEASLPFFRSLALGLLGRLLVERGDAVEGIQAIREARRLHASLGFALDEAYMVRDLSDACRRVGRIEEGLSLVDEGIAVAVRSGAGFMLAEHHRVRAALLACRSGNTAEVEHELRTARGIARQQKARLYELRAATDLSRMWWEEGRQERARTLLTRSYETFNEGHGRVADLQRAGALIQSWGRADTPRR